MFVMFCLEFQRFAETVILPCKMTNKYCGDLQRRRIRTETSQKNIRMLVKLPTLVWGKTNGSGTPFLKNICQLISWLWHPISDNLYGSHTRRSPEPEVEVAGEQQVADNCGDSRRLTCSLAE